MTLERPAWLFAGLLVAAAALLVALARRRDRSALAPFMPTLILPRHLRWRRLLEWAGLALLVLVLAGPRPRAAAGPATPAPLLVLLDTSRSMVADDVAPTRFERACADVEALLDRIPGRRVGLIAFAGAAVEACPPTSDHAALRELLATLDPKRSRDPGSCVAAALELAHRRLEREGRGEALLLSDGEWEEDAADVAQLVALFRQSGQRIATASYGSPQPVKLTLPRPGGVRVPLLQEDGTPVMSQADPARMARLAEEAGGAALAALPQEPGDLYSLLAPIAPTTADMWSARLLLQALLVTAFLLLVAGDALQGSAAGGTTNPVVAGARA